MGDVPRGTPKKQKFLQGAAVLTLGTVVVKLLGALYKIPLNRLIGAEGFGHFNMAYSIFNLLLTASTAGLPVALSRMVAQAGTLGNRRRIQQIYRVSLGLFLLLGLMSSGCMLVFARPLAGFMRDPAAAPAMAVLAPSVVFLCLCSSLRGYFQGQRYMTPTAVSQIIEAAAKLTVGLLAAAFILRAGGNAALAAAGAILGVTCGAVLAAGYLVFQYRRHRLRLTPEDLARPVPGTLETLRELMGLAVPITLGAGGMQLIYALNNRIILGRLQDALGMTSAGAAALYGIFAGAQTFYMLPAALITPLSVSVIPSVTEALTRRDPEAARVTEESAIRMTALIALPCGAGMAALSSPIQALAYGYLSGDLAAAGPILTVLGAAVFFSCMVSVTSAMLQAHGRVFIPIYATLAGGACCLGTTWLLTGLPGVGILGAAAGTLVCGAVITGLNLLALKRLPFGPRALGQLPKPMAAAVLTAAAGKTVYALFARFLSGIAGPLALALGAAVIVYGALVYALRPITWEDCQSLPQGDRIARLLGIPKPRT